MTQEQLIIAHYRSGMTVPQISEDLQVPRPTVIQIIVRAGLNNEARQTATEGEPMAKFTKSATKMAVTKEPAPAPAPKAVKPPKEPKAPRVKAVKEPKECHCGCGGQTLSNYMPGHDATHASKIANQIFETQDETLADELPTDKLRQKALDMASRMTESKADKERKAEERDAAKSAKVKAKAEAKAAKKAEAKAAKKADDDEETEETDESETEETDESGDEAPEEDEE